MDHPALVAERDNVADTALPGEVQVFLDGLGKGESGTPDRGGLGL